MTEIILKEESYLIIGKCMEVHRNMGMGFKEVLYCSHGVFFAKKTPWKPPKLLFGDGRVML